jgi:sortase A
MRVKKFVLFLAALTMVVGLAACGSFGQSSGGDQGSADKKPSKKSEQAKKSQDSASKKTKKSETPAPTQGKEKSGGKDIVAAVPKDPTLSLSIPKLNKTIDKIPTGRGDDTQLLMDNAAVHILYTGFPWQKVANVYIAGHVAGYQGTPSYKAFDGVDELQNGDDLIITDSNGKKYTYKVYEKKEISPTEVSVLNPVPGKNIVTLQTCKIIHFDANGNPDYSNTDRIIVRGELQDTGA